MHAKTRRREVRVAVYDSLHALPKRRSPEVQKQPQWLLQQAQICQQLLAVNRGKLLDRFDFDDEQTLDYQIRSETLGKDHALVLDRNWLLPINIETGFGEHRRKDSLVDSFQQPRPEVPVKLEAAIDDRSSKLFRIVQSADPFAFFASSREQDSAT